MLSFMKTPDCLVLAAFLAGGMSSQGQTLALHYGTNAPTTEGFTTGTYGQPYAVPIAGDLGHPAWGTTVSRAGVSYLKALPNLLGQDWALSVTMRVATPESRAFTTEIVTGQYFFRMYFGSTATGEPTVYAGSLAGLTPEYVLSGGGLAYHNYELRYSAATETASLLIDGAEYYSGLRGLSVPVPESRWLRWAAEWQGAELKQANWHQVSLEIIPEPAAGALFALGLGGLLTLRRSKQSPQRARNAVTEPEHGAGSGAA
jgi:hypothetical protein